MCLIIHPMHCTTRGSLTMCPRNGVDRYIVELIRFSNYFAILKPNFHPLKTKTPIRFASFGIRLSLLAKCTTDSDLIFDYSL